MNQRKLKILLISFVGIFLGLVTDIGLNVARSHQEEDAKNREYARKFELLKQRQLDLLADPGNYIVRMEGNLGAGEIPVIPHFESRMNSAQIEDIDQGCKLFLPAANDKEQSVLFEYPINRREKMDLYDISCKNKAVVQGMKTSLRDIYDHNRFLENFNEKALQNRSK
jgi:hypothetical protein